MRLVEIWDEDNGSLTIRATCIDFATAGDPVAEGARTLMALDRTTGWTSGSTGEPGDRNVILWTPRP
jgi:hypothetical protein